ncbi:DUF4245 domain-containing protein [Auraticoccus cholistanensis]|uniref:DUF4245 domain-containing protein n=1 Tax=Auraticoccus cholistanensis TaxID=2656650 RepID=UPI0018D1FED3
MARRDRTSSNPADMFRSLAVILVPILLLGALLTVRLDDYPVEPVDVRPVLTVARDEAPWPVLAPEQLPADWVPTRVTWTPQGRPGLNGEPSDRNRWVVGYLDPSQTYLAVEQADGPAAPFVADVTREGRPEATTTVGDQEWQQHVSADGRTRSLVLVADEVTTVVSGDVSYDELAAFAATLSAG